MNNLATAYAIMTLAVAVTVGDEGNGKDRLVSVVAWPALVWFALHGGEQDNGN